MLTDRQCKTAKGREKPYKLSDGHGLYLHVMPNGRAYWRLKYRIDGKEKLLALGVYPDVSLASARLGSANARELLGSGIDPSHRKTLDKIAARVSKLATFRAMAKDWHGIQGHWTPQYRKNVLHRLEIDLFPALGDRPIAEITPLELLDAIRKVESRGAGEIARRLLQVTGQIFRYAIIIGKVDRDITAGLTKALKPTLKGHFKALPEKDLPAFLADLESNRARLYRPTYIAMRMLLLTFVRTSELIGARWEEIDLDAAEWLIPAARMKKRRDHLMRMQ